MCMRSFLDAHKPGFRHFTNTFLRPPFGGSMTVIYFAYGSNLLFARLHARTPSIKNIGIGYLGGHRLSFDKPGRDGSGKCGIEIVNSDEFVFGVLYEMDRDEKPILDEIEGSGHDYIDKPVVVHNGEGAINAFTYYPTKMNQSLKPYDWYQAFVVAGAVENGFPDHYVEYLRSVESMVDPDAERSQKNFAILRGGCE